MDLRPRRILEVGSGNTTALLAAYATDSGASVVSLEHSPGFRRKTQRLLNLLGLAHEVDLRQCALQERTENGMRFHWYDYEPEAPFDFVFVDGPPKKYGREGVLYGLLPALAPQAEIWLHDGLREHERACVRRWQKDFGFEANLEEDGKGVWVLRSVRPLEITKAL
jgi:predicted O-methyltransferase YrrM